MIPGGLQFLVVVGTRGVVHAIVNVISYYISMYSKY